jgi:ribose transport system ATP-binding protein
MNLVEMSEIAKSFGNTAALKGVSFTLQPGEVHALMGENGAGKSTLMKVLAGVHKPDAGEIRRSGKVVSFANPKDALDAGISTVFQELSLLPNMTIAENVFLGREPTNAFGRVDHAKMNREARTALAELGLTLNPTTLVSELSIAQRQFVEIARGIKADASVFVLDEPTAALNAADVEVLNKHIRRLKGEGKAIVYISHRMDEIFDICDLVTVLKDGELVGTRKLSEMTPQSLIAMMVGRELADLFPRRRESVAQIVVDLEDCQLESHSRPFSLSLQRGEIVALAGLEGQGQQKILRSIIGQFAPVKGHATIKGRHLDLPIQAAGGVRKLLAMGVAFVPEDRKEEGLFLGLPIAHNIAAALHAGRPDFAIARNYRSIVAKVMEQLRIKARSGASPAMTLSGGNQQKVLLGRYLAANTDVLLIEEPTRGVDIGAKSEIYRLLREFAEKGGAVLVLSRETIELIGLCDRICVVHANTIVKTMPASEATEHNILDAALSV